VREEIVTDVLFAFPKQPQVDLKNGLEEAHVGALIQSDLMLPQIDDKDLQDRTVSQTISSKLFGKWCVWWVWGYGVGERTNLATG
jgi:hypothetical protein